MNLEWLVEFLINAPSIIRLLLRPFKDRMLKRIEREVLIERETEVTVLHAYTPPMIRFTFKLSNMTPTDISVKGMYLWIYHDAFPLMKIVWSDYEKQVDGPEMVLKLPKKGRSSISIDYAPVFSNMFRKFKRWYIRGTILLNCGWGMFSKVVDLPFDISDEQWHDVIRGWGG